MRGGDEQTGELFSYVNLEKRVRSDHPLRSIRGLVNDALVARRSRSSRRFMRRSGGRQSHRRSCCERCSCKPSIQFARSGN
jgi:hypothetical protein